MSKVGDLIRKLLRVEHDLAPVIGTALPELGPILEGVDVVGNLGESLASGHARAVIDGTDREQLNLFCMILFLLQTRHKPALDIFLLDTVEKSVDAFLDENTTQDLPADSGSDAPVKTKKK